MRIYAGQGCQNNPPDNDPCLRRAGAGIRGQVARGQGGREKQSSRMHPRPEAWAKYTADEVGGIR